MIDNILGFFIILFSFLIIIGTIKQIMRIKKRRSSSDIALDPYWIVLGANICYFVYMLRLPDYWLMTIQGISFVVNVYALYCVYNYQK